MRLNRPSARPMSMMLRASIRLSDHDTTAEEIAQAHFMLRIPLRIHLPPIVLLSTAKDDGVWA